MNLPLLSALLCPLLISPSPVTSAPIGGDADPVLLCDGPTCVADYAVFPVGGWTINANEFNGQAGQVECAPCKDCMAHVYWSYSGLSPYLVSWSGGITSGDKNGNGIFRTNNGCDQIPNEDVFTADGTEINGHLLCPCTP